MLGFAPLSSFPISGSPVPGDPEGLISLGAILGAALVLGAGATGYASNAGPLGAAQTVGAGAAGRSLMPAILGDALVLGIFPTFGIVAMGSPLIPVQAIGYHDFTATLGDVVTHYAMDLIVAGQSVRVPISSWQATLQTGAKNYVQGVVPAVADWTDAINDATEFVITRAADTSVGRIEYEMARAPLEQISIARGPTNYTATLSGYSTAFAENEEPDAAYDRTLTGIRSTTTGTAATRVRCAIDWLLRPGQRAYYDEGASFVVSYINYYVPATGDAYMDVGE